MLGQKAAQDIRQQVGLVVYDVRESHWQAYRTRQVRW